MGMTLQIRSSLKNVFASHNLFRLGDISQKTGVGIQEALEDKRRSKNCLKIRAVAPQMLWSLYWKE
jgi:hypothetical protein